MSSYMPNFKERANIALRSLMFPVDSVKIDQSKGISGASIPELQCNWA